MEKLRKSDAVSAGTKAKGLTAKDARHLVSGRKKVVFDMPIRLYEATVEIASERYISTSGLLREATEKYLADIRQQRLETELEQDYQANAALDLKISEEFAFVDADQARPH